MDDSTYDFSFDPTGFTNAMTGVVGGSGAGLMSSGGGYGSMGTGMMYGGAGALLAGLLGGRATTGQTTSSGSTLLILLAIGVVLYMVL